MLRTMVACLAMMTLAAIPASASMTIREFRKLSVHEQGIYIAAAVSMLAYSTAADGNPQRGRCIQDWYYGQPGKEPPGPAAARTELAVAEQKNPDQFSVEGVLLGLTDQVCPQSKPGAPPPR